jgi:hypothetical protein
MESITLPPKKEIYERLYSLGWKHFLNTTKIHKDLGFKHKDPEKIVNFVKITVQEYNEKYAKPSPRKYKKYSTNPLTEKDRAAIIAALFKFHPEIINYLKEKESIT